ncbi:MAG: serine protease [Saprospiraceae bacterium]
MIEQKSREAFVSEIRNETILRTQKPSPAVQFNEILGDAREKHGLRAEFYEIKDVVNSVHEAVFAAVSAYLDKMEANLKTVVMVVDAKNIEDPQDGSDCVIVKSRPLKERKVSEDPALAICPHMVYSNQQSAHSLGTAFFLRENEIATAAHVVVGFHVKFQDVRFVYGVHIEGPSSFKNEIRVHKSKVFKPQAGLTEPNAHYLSRMSSDWARIKVEQAYLGFDINTVKPVTLPKMDDYTNSFGTNGTIKGKKVYSIGHGLGLPMKISYAGEVSWRGVKSPYFETDLTLLGGSSGAPVFDAETHELLGIFIRGTKKLILGPCSDGPQRLVIKDEGSRHNGQECQRLEPVV